MAYLTKVTNYSAKLINKHTVKIFMYGHNSDSIVKRLIVVNHLVEQLQTQ